jgi:hypothetical protein
MTIAVGFRCVDGVVLAADGLYTQGIAKLYGQKIFLIPSNGYYALTIAGAGGIPSLKGAVREIRKSLATAVGGRPTDLGEIQTVIETALAAYFPKHIDSAPRNQRGDMIVELLAAVWIANVGTRLLETFRATATEVEHHRSVGTGQWLTECLGDMFIPDGALPTVEMTKPLAAYIVGRATRYVQYCGGQTFVRALLNDGRDDRVWKDEIREADEYFEEFFATVGRARGLLGIMPQPGSTDMEPFATLLKQQLVEFNKKQQAHREKHAETRQRVALGRAKR